MTDEPDTTDLKEAFALHLLLQHGDAQAAAREVMPSNRAFQTFIAASWPKDEYVLIAKQRLLNKHGEAFFLPSRYDVAHMTAKIIENAITADDKLKAVKLYAEIMGMIEKASVKVDASTNIDNRKVMIVRDYGTDDDWQNKLLQNQRKLIADGNAAVNTKH